MAGPLITHRANDKVVCPALGSAWATCARLCGSRWRANFNRRACCWPMSLAVICPNAPPQVVLTILRTRDSRRTSTAGTGCCWPLAGRDPPRAARISPWKRPREFGTTLSLSVWGPCGCLLVWPYCDYRITASVAERSTPERRQGNARALRFVVAFPFALVLCPVHLVVRSIREARGSSNAVRFSFGP